MNFEQMFLSPLGKEYCYLYYILMIYTLFQLIVVVVYSIVNIFNTKKNDMLKTIITTLIGISASVIQYIFIRLMYSVCTKSL
jgi:hypothetical protein